jgi:hypothetical protein
VIDRSPRLRPVAAACLAASAALLLRAPLNAVDPPHWAGAATTYDCTNSCHQLHASLGGALTSRAGNSNLCQKCHVSGQSASDLSTDDVNRADLAAGTGAHHAWNRSKTNLAAGADGAIASAAMSLRLNTIPATCPTGDCITCSTCHDQHSSTNANGGASRVGNAKPRAGNTSRGTVTPGGTFAGAAGAWYVAEIQATGAVGTATFRWSKDNGTTWMVSNVLTAGSVALDNGVTVAFANGATTPHFATGDRWEFSASWPFLRIPIDSGDNATGAKFCRDCHSAWTMDHTGVETWTGTLRSHPVGVALNANGAGYDRAVPLDATGVAQTTGDGNRFNDLALDAGGRVQCWSCHGAHYAPGNGAAVMP